jgi:hypothetical protein
MAVNLGRNDPCHCGSGRKYKKCCLDADHSRSRSPARVNIVGEQPDVVRPAPEAELTLVVETATGFAVRLVPAARPLPGREGRGCEAEDASADAATEWGLPDFTCTIGTVRRGNATREVADRLLVVGDAGVVIQVKARVARSEDSDKERRWLRKQIRKAISQGQGTIRTLHRQPLIATTARQDQIQIGGNAQQWMTLVIIDHPSPPDDVIPDLGSADDVCVMLRRDWEFLFDQLKSTNSVLTYLQRISGRSTELGSEPARYYDLANADASAAPGPVDLTLLPEGARAYSEPQLPMEPAGNNPADLNALRLVRSIMEDLANGPMTQGAEEKRSEALALLDRVPVRQRVEIAHLLLTWMEKAAANPNVFHMRRLTGLHGSDVQICIGVAGRLNHERFSRWVWLRHHDLQEQSGNWDEQVTIGVQLTPRHDGVRPWDTTMAAVSGDLDLTPDVLADLRAVFDR